MYKFTGESKLDVCADIAGPFFDIFADEDIVKAQKEKKGRRAFIDAVMKKHSKEVVEILARVQTEEGISTEEYIEKTGIMAIPIEFLRLTNDPMMSAFFNVQGQSKDVTSSGFAVENTEVSKN